jgi:co-chaperonin GroES (HSP10)
MLPCPLFFYLSFSLQSDVFLDILDHMKTKKNIIIVGDRVLVEPDERMDKTSSGLYLPPTVKEKEKVQGGHVVKTGPGYAIPETTPDESWKAGKKEVKYLPLQAAEGDYAIFLKDSAMEIEFEEKKYLIVPHSAILALVRTELSDDN